MNKLPINLQHPGGFVEDVMHYIDKTAVCPQPMFSLAAALSLAGTLYGRRVRGTDGQRTNLFCMTVGYTSCGKDHALKSIAKILDRADASHLRLGQVTSDSAIEWGLKRQPRMCLLIDEAGHFFAGVNDAKAKGTPQHSIKPALLELWSSANARWVGKQRVPKDGKTEMPPVTIDNPHLCLYATTQPQILFDGLSRNDLRDGWLARNLFFISTTRPKPTFRDEADVPNKILAAVADYRGEGGELVEVPDSAEAKAVFAAFNDRIYARMVAADKSGDEANYLYGKATENARRVALILAVSRAKDALHAQIGPEDATYATELVEYLISEMVRTVQESLSENADEKAKKRILKIVAQSGAKGIARNELTRKTQWVRRNMRDEYIKDLLESNQIVSRMVEDHHNHGEMLFLSSLAVKNSPCRSSRPLTTEALKCASLVNTL